MRFASLLAVTLAVPSVVCAVAVPTSDVVEYADPRSLHSDAHHELWKRRGGGGRGGGGGGRSGGKGGSSSRGGTSAPPRGHPNSNVGGRTTTGSGPKPAYGGGKYYGGGALVPIRSGAKSASGITPVLAGVGVGVVTALAFGSILHGITFRPWIYYWPHPYTFYNATVNENQTLPVMCLCKQYEVCGCDYNEDTTYLDSVIGDGRYENLNHTLVDVFEHEGNRTIATDGSLPNGTTAAGGTEDPNGAAALMPFAGYWPAAVLVAAATYMV